MTLDRTSEPDFKTVDSVHLVKPLSSKLSNGISVHAINAGDQEVVRLDVIFNAGTRFQWRPLIAAGVNEMLDEGTKTRNAEALAEELDFYGAFLESETNNDTASFTLFSLNKHLPSTLPLLQDILLKATFPEEEFGVYLANKKQQFLVDSEKVSALARRKFAGLLFGENHPYGMTATIDDFSMLKREDLVAFHQDRYALKNATIVASGRIPPDLTSLLEKTFGTSTGTSSSPSSLGKTSSSSQREHTIEKAGAIQSALRIGRKLFNKTHPDYHKMQVLNTVLGGYFGSRLMANIREDKGYTYGIGSGVVSLQDDGYFFISTEVGVDVTNAALKEIYSEIERLQNDLVSEAELELVRNYMTGVFLRSTDGPFAVAERFRGLLGYGLDYSYFDQFIQTVKSISANELRDLAQKYLKKEDLIELVAGARK